MGAVSAMFCLKCPVPPNKPQSEASPWNPPGLIPQNPDETPPNEEFLHPRAISQPWGHSQQSHAPPIPPIPAPQIRRAAPPRISELFVWLSRQQKAEPITPLTSAFLCVHVKEFSQLSEEQICRGSGLEGWIFLLEVWKGTRQTQD